ncbi:MAG: Tol-Pal system beta propeller repeat protein TolB [Candidatus Raymondbacteria bacterium RifOxyA12_full_50_37]|uniref:Tol-Pal system beta propeller repeat protein TolB n=1 Tax=Candidatus Raymondbacteria bacterium RIFOXYD12_FULL_49_13 TaxID=1817890 RepID=A0A1F7F494_UNCRA|nr:MAG: Tol-Pal system beta propeller repeat protein TolB [Candidatus Raymondbacteria bacterium RifOxyA12_full_50_37]OGJ86217.1 MAG: Tol-Pal system beta propeller repeat protein TolB [Candidatus Raymondbacteria bacterium RIFOXYA2_FULL_49_16]OGJ95755.1 MAG: Tol-Pal system beta propeller repeat protein TolB [Candidatus Raymondbacteria bacterium RIFOXYC2_FULL_50_21]OGJ98013.1 MAG: Tol-Pal system beta propeller repeat protein TolB [Candidatus Raymondbacteria bacterium RifOxyC12_full_50_8]OGJ99148.1
MLLLLLIAISVIQVSSPAEELFLESTSSGIPKMDIAVVDFVRKNLGPGSTGAAKPHEVIVNDLKLSGRFNVFPMNTLDTVTMHKKNIAVFIEGTIDQSKGNTIFECFLHDAYSLNLITGKRFNVKDNAVRKAAHLFSDEVVYQLFGEKGIATTKIVCTMRGPKGKDVCVLDYDGYNPVYITRNNYINLTPAWSPDNQAVYYTSYRDKTPALYKTFIYTGQTVRLTPNAMLNFSPTSNPIDSRIAFASTVHGNSEIYIMEGDGTDIARLTFQGSIESSPCFSPNGYEITFTSDRTGSPQIYIMDSEGTNVRRLTFEGKYNASPSWSPKGDKIAYQSMVEGVFNICTIDIEGGAVQQLTTKSGNNEHPSFSADGRLIMFSSTRAGASDLYIMNADGSNQTRITTGGGYEFPEWSGR